MNEKKIKEWFFRTMQTHEDWTGKRVETKYECKSVQELIENFMNFIDEQ